MGIEGPRRAKTVLWPQYSPLTIGTGGTEPAGDSQIARPNKLGDLGDGSQTSNPENFWFYMENKASLPKIEPVHVQGGFSSNNIIHRIMSIESQLFKPEKVERAYEILGTVLAEVKARVTEGMSGKEKLLLVYQVLQEKGYKLEEQDDISFISNLLRGELDCDTSSFVVLAVAQELGVPAGLVILPDHTFVRLEDGTNIDYGKVAPDNLYLDYFAGLKEITVSTQSGIEAYVYDIRAGVFSQRGDWTAAKADFDRAIALGSADARSYCNRAWLEFRQGNYEAALADCNQAIGLNPLPTVKVSALFLRAQLHYLYGRYEEAKQDCESLFAFNLDAGSRKAVKSLLQGILSEQKVAKGVDQVVFGGRRI